jgi:ribonuclease HI
MNKKKKFYVVWAGHEIGIFDNWDDCKKNIKGFPGARYQSFANEEEAKKAFTRGYVIKKSKSPLRSEQEVNWDSICVDAACSGNPGILEYQGVDTKTGKEIFRQGPFNQGTNNIGEFLAIVHGLALMNKKGNAHTGIYTDSQTAIKWIRDKKVKTKLQPTNQNKKLFNLIDRATTWLKTHSYSNPILKWNTKEWGEIPADFNRK